MEEINDNKVSLAKPAPAKSRANGLIFDHLLVVGSLLLVYLRLMCLRKSVTNKKAPYPVQIRGFLRQVFF